MRKIFINICIVVGCLNLVCCVQQPLAQPDTSPSLVIEEDQKQDLSESEIRSLDFEGVSLEEALDTLTVWTGAVYIVEGNSAAVLNTQLDKMVTADDLIDLIKGEFSVVFLGEGPAVTVAVMPDDQLLGAERIGKVFPVRQAGVEKMAALLKKDISSRGKVLEDRKNQQLVIWDQRDNMLKLKARIFENDVAVKTEVFSLTHRSVSALRKEIEKMVDPRSGQVSFDTKMQTIVVTDTAPHIEKIREFLKAADKPKEVILHAGIFRVQLNEEHQDGVDWEAIVGDYRQLSWVNASENLQASQGMDMGKLNTEDYDVLMDALDAVGHVVHLISPDIKLIADVERTIVLDTNDPFCPRKPSLDDEAELPTVLDPQGFQMQITMSIHENSEGKQLSVFPSLYWMEAQDAESTDMILTVDKAEKITLKPGDHLIFGGLLRGESVELTRKVPFLGNLPFVGGAFRLERSREENLEYMVFFSLEEINTVKE